MEVDQSSNRYFCPYCGVYYAFHFLLKGHIDKEHAYLLQDNLPDFQCCPVCNVKFCDKYIVAKHAIYYHESFLQPIFESSTDKSKLKCIFCLYTVQESCMRLLTMHIEKRHLLEFCSILMNHKGEMCSRMILKPVNGSINEVRLPISKRISTSKESNAKISDGKPVNCFEFAELKQFLEECQTRALKNNAFQSKRKPPPKSIIKQSNDRIKNSDTISQGTKRKSIARKSLRFDVSDVLLVEKENVRNGPQGQKCGSIFSEKSDQVCDDLSVNHHQYLKWSSSPKQTSTPSKHRPNSKKKHKISPIPKLKPFEVVKRKNALYKCSRCWKLFDENQALLLHVSKAHKKLTLNILQPNYQCGKCNVKFFENQYLKRHCQTHHTPDSLDST